MLIAVGKQEVGRSHSKALVEGLGVLVAQEVQQQWLGSLRKIGAHPFLFLLHTDKFRHFRAS